MVFLLLTLSIVATSIPLERNEDETGGIERPLRNVVNLLHDLAHSDEDQDKSLNSEEVIDAIGDFLLGLEHANIKEEKNETMNYRNMIDWIEGLEDKTTPPSLFKLWQAWEDESSL